MSIVRCCIHNRVAQNHIRSACWGPSICFQQPQWCHQGINLVTKDEEAMCSSKVMVLTSLVHNDVVLVILSSAILQMKTNLQTRFLLLSKKRQLASKPEDIYSLRLVECMCPMQIGEGGSFGSTIFVFVQTTSRECSKALT